MKKGKKGKKTKKRKKGRGNEIEQKIPDRMKRVNNENVFVEEPDLD